MATVAQVNKKLNELETSYDAKFKQMEAAHDLRIAKLETDIMKKCEEKLAKMKTQFDKKLTSLEHENTTKDVTIKQLTKDLEDAKTTLNYISQETTDLEKSVDDNRTAIKVSRDDVNNVINKTDDLEDRSRRNNLVFFNVKEAEDGSNENCEQIIQQVLLSNNITGSDSVPWIDRAHRLGPVSKKHEGKTRPIIVRFTYYRQKQAIIDRGNLLRHSPINMSEDYSRTTLDIHRKLLKAAKDAKQSNKNIKSYKLMYRKIRVSAQLPSNERFISKTFSLADMDKNVDWFKFVH